MTKRLFLTLGILLGLASQSFAQPTAGATFIYGQYQFSDANGAPLNGGKICTFAAGSSTPHSTWSDSGLSVLNSNPVILNAAGRAPIYLDGTNYKIQVLTAGTDSTCSTGTTVFTQDNVEDLANVFFNTKQTANTVYAGPNTGAAAIPSFRTLIAADIPTGGVDTIVSTTSTGTQANFAPGLVGNTIVLCNNASLLTISGIAGGVSGQRVRFISKGAGIVGFTHQDAGSTAANRLINDATTAATSLQAGLGAIEYVYDGVASRWHIAFHNQGGWITPAFSAGNFTAGGAQTWTVSSGEVSDYKYYLSGNQLAYQVNVQNTTVGGTPNVSLFALVPGGFTIATVEAEIPSIINDNAGGFAVGDTEVIVGHTTLTFYKAATLTGNWTNATTATSVFSSGVIAVQ